MKNPTFGIYLANGQKKPGLLKAFLENHMIEWNQTEIILADGSIWPIIREDEVVNEHIKHSFSVPCICSFQVYETGEFYCVARKKGY